MRALTRSVGLLAATAGLIVAFASAAGATTCPTVQKLVFPSSFGTTSPCDGSFVATTGTAVVTTATDGQHTSVVFVDNETGDGYVFIEVLANQFTSLASSYPGQGVGFWLNKNPAKDFRASIASTVSVTSANAPTGVSSLVTSASCGL